MQPSFRLSQTESQTGVRRLPTVQRFVNVGEACEPYQSIHPREWRGRRLLRGQGLKASHEGPCSIACIHSFTLVQEHASNFAPSVRLKLGGSCCKAMSMSVR